ncbi:RNase adapter RapZ [Cocleimonas sp. KMM 6892]|uniref:RNase adapter RapZ n=1 Tax=unclassified Cocleimonas TaxID=2639732 RepID=UPI002DB69703|nr:MULTISPECIES: RNase adapter RapZ [unclassified Cocleimonas]MEB8432354.1 RNase adapter RapZ [Cocleimonas sp. KMM 6892]MEC4714560.1 RNase adapter RapZ [Cocleimonas sp. KMM 6895]MEC4744626.1 RNase adapter RapZ [Cocleimonas sp. KMM 6896]
MHIIIVSGMSGAGKTQVLHTLEDQGYYCIDNLPLELFENVFETERLLKHQKIAVGVDIRSGKKYLKKLPEMVTKLKRKFKTDVIYLYAGKSVLIKRYDETRRKHPLSSPDTTLRDAILKEYDLIEPIRVIADIQIDTSTTNIYELASKITSRVSNTQHQSLSLMFQSFGFKHGTPRDSDYLFDVRCLPNPYWIHDLRPYTGLDKEVSEWLSSHELVNEMEKDLKYFIEKWIPKIISSQRAYLTISIGCTGGHHRSVYLIEKLAKHFETIYKDSVIVQHRELD